eukprot:448886_1
MQEINIETATIANTKTYFGMMTLSLLPAATVLFPILINYIIKTNSICYVFSKMTNFLKVIILMYCIDTMQQGFRHNRLILRCIIYLCLIIVNQIILSLIDAKINSKNIKLIKLIFKRARSRYKYDNTNYAQWIEVCRELVEFDIVNPLLFRVERVNQRYFI